MQKRQKILVTNFNSNPNVGLYGFATSKYCLIGREVPEKFYKSISEALDVKVIPMTIAGTSLLGVLLNGNNKCLIVPKIAFSQELEILDKHKIKYKVMDTKLTCLGNNMICTDDACILSNEYGERDLKFIKDNLKVKTYKARIARLNNLGSLAVHNKRGILCHHEILEDEADELTKILKLNITTGTVNMGNPFVGSGILCNDKGFVIGDMSGGPEIMNAEEALMKK
ncbi:TPA: translation initiation factor IF-6 [Candidatus Woesearchaeota archaeon]|nr:translation initiation factor IF-6 [Candidatus Woesearchaeota archaeon]HIH32512.1 translation initiation factor IF-6 [Candidatus Woesearchaeota archaeon]HIH54152.1 translation initiation factor IF-6 [Candidatus Woesearchaeota archaeon]HIJ01695.1 translation initiation factor IF-6 [Candidatus Woesearchaeota archaeon]HIJ13265.1 translation initiation factor IF-6 [Candidatus Woesearchaeota archaeon]